MQVLWVTTVTESTLQDECLKTLGSHLVEIHSVIWELG